ncbi:MAG: 1,4-dihydroxy-6-naphthoate synthase [Nitrospirae bacterium]|nr:1,4-dihydroxy-6-naphthoate synthase [Nitrospirota bacterium]
MPELTLGYSPCPNDTFIFHAMTRGLLDCGGITFRERLEDVETLNRLALAGSLDITKVSYHALGALRDKYFLLRSGGALGRGCGPLLVARSRREPAALAGKKIAIPGRLTTAFLLLRLFDPSFGGPSFGSNIIAMPFHEIMGAVSSGEVDAGLIIHESRFTYPAFGLVSVLDLGQWWEQETGLPIPLGCIAARRDMGDGMALRVESIIRASVRRALDHPDEPASYIRAHAQEMDETVIRRHIALYVNDFSLDLGDEGERAVTELLARAESAGIVQAETLPLFAVDRPRTLV